MSDIDITLYLNEYRVRALANALGNRTAETVEDKLTEAFDTLYQEYVSDEHRAAIEAKIERENTIEQARREAADALRFTTSVKTVTTTTLQAITSEPQCRQLTAIAFMSAAGCLLIPKYSLPLLLKRSPSVLNISARFVRISIRITESQCCSNLIWTRGGSAFITAQMTNGRPTLCMIFPLRLTKRSAPITEARNAAVKYSTTALREKKWICQKPMTNPKPRRCRCDRRVSPCVAPCGEIQPRIG